MNKILFVSRKFPPQTGGMENVAWVLSENLKGITEKIILKKKQIHLVWFVPWAILRSVSLIRKFDTIYCADAIMACSGWLPFLLGKKVIVEIHGLDLTFAKTFPGQKLPIKIIKRLYGIYLNFILNPKYHYVCHSQRVKEILSEFGILKPFYLPYMIDATRIDLDQADIKDVEKKYNLNLRGKFVMLTVGRLIKRKGVKWFVKKVIPKIRNNNCLYIIVGSGPDSYGIEENIQSLNLDKKVILLKGIPNEFRNALYKRADVFIMPNIRVPGDVEGVGIVMLEAGSQGTPTIAANVDGVSSVIQENLNGYLVAEKDHAAFVKKINQINGKKVITINKKEIRRYVIKQYDWKNVIKEYEKVLNGI